LPSPGCSSCSWGSAEAARTTYGLRFRAYGRREYVALGTAAEGWTHAKAQTELQNILADVRRGIWRPAAVEVVETPREVPTFHAFATEWFERQTLEGGRRGSGLSTAGRDDLQWRLSSHLLPVFPSRRLDQITVEDVHHYRLAKVRQGNLGATSINKTLTTLAAILETAVEYELIDRPADGPRDGEPDRLKLLVDGRSSAAALDRSLGASERARNATRSGRRLSDEGPN
jgi:hypothetical protein